MVRTLDYDRLTRLDNECEARQKQKLDEIRDARKKRDDAEDARRNELASFVSAWKEAKEIRAYLSELKQKLDSKELQASIPVAFENWLEWASWYADYIDPLATASPRPEFAPAPKNTPVDQLDLTRRGGEIVAQMGAKDTDDLATIDRDKLPYDLRYSWKEIERVLEVLDYPIRPRQPYE